MKILIIVPPERFDFYNYLDKLGGHEFILLWSVDEKEMKWSLKDLPINFKYLIYWYQFNTPKVLLYEINPDKIIFFEIIDLRQIALIVTAKDLNITTFYLEHGAAGDKETAISRWKETTFIKNKLPYLIKRITSSFFDILKSKVFYFSVNKGFESKESYIKYLKLPFLMLGNGPNKVLAQCNFRERVPKYSIVFNQINYEQYETYTGISYQDALLTGVPFFDKYFTTQQIEKNYIVYIEHPYLEENILGWSKDFHRKIANTLFDFAEKNQIKIFIKLHPISNIKHWENYEYNNKYIEILQQGDFTELYLKSKLILGYSSSLLTGLLSARKNIVLLGWHPEPQIFGMDFSKTGLCHTSFDPNDLKEKYNHWINENKSNDLGKYETFLKQCNYPFDGRATQRVLEAITSL